MMNIKLRSLMRIFLCIFICSFPVYGQLVQEGGESFSGSHFLVLGFDANTTATFVDGARSSDTDESFDTEIDFESKSSYGYEYRHAPPCRWGVSIGIMKYTKAMIIGVKEDGRIQFDYDKDEVDIYTAYVDAIMRFTKFFFSFGFNKTNITYTPEDSSIDVESKNEMGFNFGLGWHISEWVVVEYGLRNNVWKLKKTEDDGTITDFGDGVLNISTLQLKLRFF